MDDYRKISAGDIMGDPPYLGGIAISTVECCKNGVCFETLVRIQLDFEVFWSVWFQFIHEWGDRHKNLEDLNLLGNNPGHDEFTYRLDRYYFLPTGFPPPMTQEEREMDDETFRRSNRSLVYGPGGDFKSEFE